MIAELDSRGEESLHYSVGASRLVKISAAREPLLIHYSIGSRMSTRNRAIEIAAAAHAGQVDKAGKPNILHPIREMLRLSGAHERMGAVLHDVVKDMTVSLE